jgi:hypothetical protein
MFFGLNTVLNGSTIGYMNQTINASFEGSIHYTGLTIVLCDGVRLAIINIGLYLLTFNYFITQSSTAVAY